MNLVNGGSRQLTWETVTKPGWSVGHRGMHQGLLLLLWAGNVQHCPRTSVANIKSLLQ